MDKKIITADYLLDAQGKARKGWGILVRDAVIEKVGPLNDVLAVSQNTGTVDLGRALLSPGLINCHNHLELTSLGPRIHRTKIFTDWLDEVRELRDSLDDDYLVESTARGVDESVAAGVTTVVDHCKSGTARKALESKPIRAIIAHELIAFDRKTFAQRKPEWEERLAWPESERFRHGLAPHAPYSTSRELLKWVKRYKDEHDFVVSMHTQEHPEEVEFLKTGRGYFHDFLEHLGIPQDEFDPPGVGPVQYLNDLGLLGEKFILVHGNYLTDEDVETIRTSGTTVCYCPRSHHYFYHENHPLPTLLKAGINVVLGTDSMVSNWSLSLLEEMQYVYKNYDGISPETIFSMATRNGARAIGEEKKLGCLAEGYAADIIAIKLPGADGEVLKDALGPEAKNILTMIGGEIVHRSDQTNGGK
jgi:cytosine/adenosine deaminase-related metal-dependent hydrolase